MATVAEAVAEIEQESARVHRTLRPLGSLERIGVGRVRWYLERSYGGQFRSIVARG
jgi:hypothetical protein